LTTSDNVKNIHNEEQIVINPKDSLNLVACWRDWRLGYRRVAIGYSFDGGLTWDDYLVEGSPFWRDSDPGLTTDADGNIYLIVLSFVSIGDSNALTVFKSTNGGQSFGEPSNAVLSGAATFEDKELIACDRTTSEHRGNLYVVWTRFSGYSTRIHSTTSKDEGQTWTDPVMVSDQVDVQWPVPCVGKDGTLYTAWVKLFPHAVMLDRSFDAGATWGTDITVTNLPLIGDIPIRIDGFIGTFPFPAMDADITNGPYAGNLYIAYLDQGANASMDIFFTRSEDRGETWSDPVPIVGEDVPDNDQFHPWLTVDNTGVIHVIFYDQRNGIADDLLDIYYVSSEDGGHTWSEPLRVTDVSSKPIRTGVFSTPMPMPAELMGEYIGLAAYNGRPFPVWTDCREDGIQNIYFGYHTTDAIKEKRVADAGHILNASFVSEGLRIHFAPAEIGTYHFALYDVSGRALGSIAQSSSDFVWDTGSLPKGVYFIQVRGQDSEQTVKVIKLR
jgi:hypothetical protein